jgi:hypothetical protein
VVPAAQHQHIEELRVGEFGREPTPQFGRHHRFELFRDVAKGRLDGIDPRHRHFLT